MKKIQMWSRSVDAGHAECLRKLRRNGSKCKEGSILGGKGTKGRDDFKKIKKVSVLYEHLI